jgi:HK97 family phage major capsid protein
MRVSVSLFSCAMFGALAAVAAFMGGALDPIMQLLGVQPDAIVGTFVLANAVVAFDKKTVTDQIVAFDNRRTAAIDRANTLMAKSSEEGRTLDETESQEYEGLLEDVKSIDKHLGRLKTHEALLIKDATPVHSTSGQGEGAVEIRGTGPLLIARNLPKGTSFTRYSMALATSKGNLLQAERIAERWKDTPEVGIILKAAVQEGTTSDATWAGSLVQYQDMVGEFIDLLRAQTILGRLTQLRRVPFNIRIQRQTAGTTGSFVGEGLPTPVKELAAEAITLPWAKASTIVVVSAELARFSSPSAEAMVRDDLLAGIAEFLDKRLVDPAYPGVANVSPGSLTNGVTPRQASGASIAAIDTDIRTVTDTMGNANLDLTSCVWVMSSTMANRLSKIRTSQDEKAYPDIRITGGTFEGLPVIVSNNVTPSGSPGDQHIILVNQREVLLADDGQMTLDVSSEASLEFDDAPTGGATTLRSLWQNGLIGMKVERFVYWTKRRTQAVQFIDKAQSYGS